MGVALKKLKGVETVEVKLNSGLAIVRLKSGNRILLQEMRQVITDRGFTPGDAIVKFTGTINSENGKTWVEVSDVGEVLNLNGVTANGITTLTGKTLLLEGKVAAPKKNSKTAPLQLTELRNL